MIHELASRRSTHMAKNRLVEFLFGSLLYDRVKTCNLSANSEFRGVLRGAECVGVACW